MPVKELNLPLGRIDKSMPTPARGFTNFIVMSGSNWSWSGESSFRRNLVAHCDLAANNCFVWYDQSPYWVFTAEVANKFDFGIGGSIIGSPGTYLFSTKNTVVGDDTNIEKLEQTLMKSLQLVWYLSLGRDNVQETIRAAGQILRADAELSKAARALTSIEKLLVEGEGNKEG